MILSGRRQGSATFDTSIPKSHCPSCVPCKRNKLHSASAGTCQGQQHIGSSEISWRSSCQTCRGPDGNQPFSLSQVVCQRESRGISHEQSFETPCHSLIDQYPLPHRVCIRSWLAGLVHDLFKDAEMVLLYEYTNKIATRRIHTWE